jgi:hypothetical protein
MHVFPSLPSEIRFLIYENLVNTEPDHPTKFIGHSVIAKVNCSIPISFLLVSRVFSKEILYVMSTIRHVKLEVSSSYRFIDDVISLWPSIVRYQTRILSVHMFGSLEDYRRRGVSQDDEYQNLIQNVWFLIKGSTEGVLTSLHITIDLPPQNKFRNLTYFLHRDINVVKYRDLWHGCLCEKSHFTVETEEKRVGIGVLIRSQLK